MITATTIFHVLVGLVGILFFLFVITEILCTVADYIRARSLRIEDVELRYQLLEDIQEATTIQDLKDVLEFYYEVIDDE